MTVGLSSLGVTTVCWRAPLTTQRSYNTFITDVIEMINQLRRNRKKKPYVLSINDRNTVSEKASENSHLERQQTQKLTD